MLLIRRDRRELHVRLLGDRARLRHFHGHARHPTQLVFGENRARGEAPHATVNHAHPEAARCAIRVARDALLAATAAASTTTATTTARAPTTRAGAARGRAGTQIHGRPRKRGGHGEAHVGVAATGQLAFGEHDIGEPLETRLEDEPLRRIGEHLPEQIARVQRERRTGAELPDKISTGIHKRIRVRRRERRTSCRTLRCAPGARAPRHRHRTLRR